MLLSHNRLEAAQRRAKILNYLISKHCRLRKILQIGHRSVLQPEHVEARLVAQKKLLARIGAPSTIRGFLAPSLFPDMAVLGLVARNEVLKMGIGQRLLLERVMHVGAVIV